MVLWEITVATAYFLGLKRTYRIALRLQRRIVGQNHPRIRQFLHRRTRAIFDVAVNVHMNIQRRDLEAGKNLGNWLLRFLDRMKPSAQIRVSPEKLPATTCRPPNPNNSVRMDKPTDKISDQIDENRRLISSFNKKFVPLPAIMMMKPMKPTNQAQNHHLCSNSVQNFCHRRGHYDDVIRRDIALWMHLR